MNYKSHQGLTCILIFMENGNTKSSASPFPGDWWRIKKSIGASKYMGVNLVSEAKSDEYCSLNMRADRRVVQPPSIVPIIRWHRRLHPRLEKPCKSLFKCAASKFTASSATKVMSFDEFQEGWKLWLARYSYLYCGSFPHRRTQSREVWNAVQSYQRRNHQVAKDSQGKTRACISDFDSPLLSIQRVTLLTLSRLIICPIFYVSSATVFWDVTQRFPRCVTPPKTAAEQTICLGPVSMNASLKFLYSNSHLGQ